LKTLVKYQFRTSQPWL